MNRNGHNGEGLPGSLWAFMDSHLRMPRQEDPAEYVWQSIEVPAVHSRPPDVHPTRPPDITDSTNDPMVRAIKAMVDAGLSKDKIADAVSLIAGKTPICPPDIHPTSTRQDQIEARRKWDREYKRRKRAEKANCGIATAGEKRPPDTEKDAPIPNTSLFLEDSQQKESKSSGIRAREKRGYRLPADFELTEPMREFAKTLLRGDEINHEFAQFCDYWWSASGQKAVKLDWVAAWRQWCRNAVKFNRNGGGNARRDKSALAAADRIIDHFGGQSAAESYIPGSEGPACSVDHAAGQTDHKRVSKR